MSEHPIFDEFINQCAELERQDEKPCTVVFSHEGWAKALKEAHKLGDLNIGYGPSATYGGLHRCFDDRPGAAQLVVTKVTQQEYFVPRERNRAISFAMKGTFGKLGDSGVNPKTMIELVAQSLDAATLCDIIRSWLDSDDATHWGAFEKSLDNVITLHGRFPT